MFKWNNALMCNNDIIYLKFTLLLITIISIARHDVFAVVGVVLCMTTSVLLLFFLQPLCLSCIFFHFTCT